MSKFTIETTDEITVSKRDGSTIDVDMTKIPESFFADFVTDGVAEYIRDSSSAAMSNAYTLANPKCDRTGDSLKSARVTWVGKDGNVEKVATESAALMTAARDRLYAGERRVPRESTSDPMDQWRIKVLRQVMRTDVGVAMKAAHDAIDSTDQADRRAYLLGVAAKNDWVEVRAIALKAASDAERAAIKESAVAIDL